MSKTRRSHSTFRIPNQLILDKTLTFSARRLGAVLYGHHNALGFCRKSLASLAKLSKLSVTTVRKAVSELSDAGYIASLNTYRYNDRLGRMVYAVSVYQCLLPVDRDFTLIPRAIFDAPISSSAFVTALYLYQQTGNSTRCFPSLRALARDIGASVATVCLAVKLGIVRLFYCLHCKKVNHAYSNNSYHILFQSRRVETSTPLSAPEKRLSPPLVGSAPFPDKLQCIIRSLRFQLFSFLGGVLKICKLQLRLR